MDLSDRKVSLVVDTVMDLLLQLSPSQRSEAFRDVRCNPIFCVECGIGSDEQPNRNCQCWNED